MINKIGRFITLHNRWILRLLFGSGLIVFLIWLIVAHYKSHVEQHIILLKGYQYELDLQVLALNRFFMERRDEVFDLSRRQTVRNYFVGKVLEERTLYGLKTRRQQVEALFNAIISRKNINGKPIYNEIAILDNNANELVSVYADRKRRGRIYNKLDMVKLKAANMPVVMLLESNNNNCVVLIMPISIKGKFVGCVVVGLNKCLIINQIFGPSQKKYGGGTLLLARKGEHLIPICGDIDEPGSYLKIIDDIAVDSTLNAPFLLDSFKERIVYLASIEETPLVVFVSVERHMLESSPHAEYILYFMIAVISVIIAGFAMLIRSEIRSSHLRSELTSREMEKVKELENINSKLDREVVDRLAAEEKTKHKNELLSGLNSILLDALQESSVEDIANECVAVVCELTGCEIGFIGTFTKEGYLITLGFLDTEDDECQMDICTALTGKRKTGVLEIFAKIIKTGELLTINDPQAVEHAVGFDNEHVTIQSLLFAPLLIDGQVAGIIGIAHKNDRFDVSDAENVKELSASFITVLVQKQTDEALRLSEERNRTLVESITEGLLIVDENTCITYINDNMLAMLEIEEAHVHGRSLYEFLDGENRNIVKKNVENRKNGSEQPYELVWSTPSGAKIHTMVYPKPFFGDNGQFKGALALITDLSASKARESQILQTQKLEAIGQLAAGIAHEINTPTNFVANNTIFLKDGFAGITKALDGYAALRSAYEKDQPIQPVLESIQKLYEENNLEYILKEVPRAIDENLEGLDRISKIVRSMKEFAHPGADSKSFVNLNDSIRNTVTVAKNEWKYIANLEMDLEPDLPLAMCVSSQINQVILNLIINAAQAIAMKHEENAAGIGAIKISTREVDDQIEIRIADNGTGIPEKLHQRIFEPFFTTKEPGKGTGQGLAIAHTVIVEKHGGSIKLESDGKMGTTFIICLPVISEKGEA